MGPVIADELERLLSDDVVRNALQDDIARVVAMLGEGGSHERAASCVIAALGAD